MNQGRREPMPRELKYIDCNRKASGSVREDEQAEKNGFFFLEQLHVMAELGGRAE